MKSVFVLYQFFLVINKKHIASILTVAFLFLVSGQSFAWDNLRLHSVGLRVSDVEKSLNFYQSVLGLPIQAEKDNTLFLRFGEGPSYLSLAPTIAGEKPRISHIGLSVDNFSIESWTEALDKNGFTATSSKIVSNENRLTFSKSYWINANTLHFIDEEGVEIQISASDYCGVEKSHCKDTVESLQGKFNVRGLNHFTTFMSNAPRANQFYRSILDIGIQSFQGPNIPALGVGDGLQFLMFVGPAMEGRPKNPANLHHVSLMVTDFNVDNAFTILQNAGLSARPDGVNTTSPMQYYVSLRMPARGGAEGGTPEVYFTDPDGILLQIQDPSYCGGSGYLGNRC